MTERENDTKRMLSMVDELMRLAEDLMETLTFDLSKEYSHRDIPFKNIEHITGKGIKEGYTTGYGDSEFIEPDIALNKRENGTIEIVVDMPGISKEEIVVVPKGKNLIILGGAGKLRYYRSIKVPFKLDKNSIKWSYGKGTLRILCSKKPWWKLF